MLRQFIAVVILLAAASMACAGEAAHVVFVAGNVHVAKHAVALGDAINEGDEIATGADGYIYMKTVDDGFLILRPNSSAQIIAYHIDQQNPANTRVKLQLLSGVARSISGVGVKQARQNFRFNTPVAAIGVRGTDFTVFTDQEISRVTVISGGIVVSGFGGACLPEGNGPCEGNASRELFADKVGQLLQIKRGQLTPQILSGKGIAPDLNAPPRNDEPAASKTAAATSASVGNATLAPVDLSLDPQKSQNLTADGTPPPAPPAPPVVVVPPPPVVVTPPPTVVVIPVPPVPATPAPQEILWGRWEAIANLPPDSAALAKVSAGGYEGGTSLGGFFITRVTNTQLVLPNTGQASFNLQNSEAYITQGQTTVPATVQNAQLNVNFANSSFTTSLQVVAPGEQVDVTGQGSVTNRGLLVGNNLYSNAVITGYLGGAAVQQAAYLFQTNNSSTTTAFGATTWGR